MLIDRRSTTLPASKGRGRRPALPLSCCDRCRRRPLPRSRSQSELSWPCCCASLPCPPGSHSSAPMHGPCRLAPATRRRRAPREQPVRERCVFDELRRSKISSTWYRTEDEHAPRAGSRCPFGWCLRCDPQAPRRLMSTQPISMMADLSARQPSSHRCGRSHRTGGGGRP
jgi:hypothetical protein